MWSKRPLGVVSYDGYGLYDSSREVVNSEGIFIVTAQQRVAVEYMKAIHYTNITFWFR